jgi:hypothetical protein
MSAFQFCNPHNDDSDPQNRNYSDICKNRDLLSKIKKIDPDAAILDVYGCTKPSKAPRLSFNDPQTCAAANRGTTDQRDFANFYVTPPYNKFAKYVHDDLKLFILTFPFDDYPPEATTQPNPKYGEYINCSDSTYTEVMFCPDAGSSAFAALGDRLLGGSNDADHFLFSANRQERVTLRVSPLPGGIHGPAFLMVSQGEFSKKVQGRLPLLIKGLVLPRNGQYKVTVHNKLPHQQGHVGRYKIDLRSTGNAWRTLKATSTVE